MYPFAVSQYAYYCTYYCCAKVHAACVPAHLAYYIVVITVHLINAFTAGVLTGPIQSLVCSIVCQQQSPTNLMARTSLINADAV